MADEDLAELAELTADVRAAVEVLCEAGLRELPASPPEVLQQVAEAPWVRWTPPRARERPPERPSRPAPPRIWDPGPTRRPSPTTGQQAPPEGLAEAGVGPEGMAAIREILGDCGRCALCRARKNVVFGVGDPEADLLICGEGPGAREDALGEPFVGPAGQMLDRMLEHVLGLARTEVYIVNVVKCRPPGNRTPLPEEIAACRPFLDAQIAAVRPKVILSLGRPATQTLLRTGRGIKSLRGRWQLLDGVPVMPTFHPAYLLRQAQDKRLTFQDLKDLRERYDELGGRRG